MSVTVIFLFVLAVLFVIAFVTRRRFGVLGLALAAGSMLSELWAGKLTPLVRDAGVTVQNLPLPTLVAVTLVLLPALLLLFSGPRYQGGMRRFIGALLFAVLASALLVEPLGSALALQGDGRAVYEFIHANRVYIVTIGLILALFDLLSVHTRKVEKPPKH